METERQVITGEERTSNGGRGAERGERGREEMPRSGGLERILSALSVASRSRLIIERQSQGRP